MLDNVYFEVNNVQKKNRGKYEVMSKSNMLGKSKEKAILYHDLFTPLALALQSQPKCALFPFVFFVFLSICMFVCLFE